MRVTQKTLVNDFVRGISNTRRELSSLQKQLSSGKTVSVPSDNPSAFSNAQELSAEKNRNNVFQNNAQLGIEQAQQAGDSLAQILDQMAELKKLVVQATNGAAVGLNEMEILADNVAGVRQRIVQLANTNYQDRFLFAGTATQTLPFSISGTSVSYNGNSENLSVPVNNQSQIESSIAGDALFNIDETNESLFQVIERIEIELRNGNQENVRNELPNIDFAQDSLGRKAGKLGNNIIRLEFSLIELETANINIEANVSRLTDVDVTEAFSRVQSLQTSFQAALSAGSPLLQLTLANFL